MTLVVVTPPWLIPQLLSHGAYSWCSALAHFQLQDDSQHCSGSPEDTPRSSGASGIFSLRNLASDSLLPALLERAAPEDVDRRNEALRRQHRAPALLTLYPAPDEVGARAHCPSPDQSLTTRLGPCIYWLPTICPSSAHDIIWFLSDLHLLSTKCLSLHLFNQYPLYAY